MNLLAIRINSLRLASLFYQTNKPIIIENKIRSKYELDVIGHYERFGWVEKQDRHIIDNYQEKREGPDRSYPERDERVRDHPSQYDEPEWKQDPEYPFEDFNYGP